MPELVLALAAVTLLMPSDVAFRYLAASEPVSVHLTPSDSEHWKRFFTISEIHSITTCAPCCHCPAEKPKCSLVRFSLSRFFWSTGLHSVVFSPNSLWPLDLEKYLVLSSLDAGDRSPCVVRCVGIGVGVGVRFSTGLGGLALGLRLMLGLGLVLRLGLRLVLGLALRLALELG